MSERTQPVYLISTSRSGSNLLRSILGGHSVISAPAPFETAFPLELPDVSGDRRRKYVRDVLIWQQYSPHGLHEELDPAAVDDRMDEWTFYELQRALYERYAEREDSDVWVTKHNGKRFRTVPEAVEFYDDLKLIYLVRDGRDVALSFKTAMTGPYHPFYSSNLWSDEQSIGGKLQNDGSVSLHTVKYEDLLQDPNSEIRDVCDFLGVDVENELLSYHEREDTNHMAENAHMFENISKPILKDNYGKFREELPEEELKLVEKIAGDELRRFGYDLVYSPEELDRIDVPPKSAYRDEEKSRREEFSKRMWRNSPKEILGLRLGQKFKFFLRLRYSFGE